MEVRSDGLDVGGHDLWPQAGIDAPGEFAGVEIGTGIETEDLGSSVDTGIGTPRHVDLLDRPEYGFEHRLQLADHGAHPGVGCQPAKSSTVVGDGEPDPLCHSDRG